MKLYQRMTKRSLSFLLAAVLAVPVFGSLAFAKESSDVLASISLSGVSEKGKVSVVFTADNSSWSHTYSEDKGIFYLDGEKTDSTTVSLPKESGIRVDVIGDASHQITAVTAAYNGKESESVTVPENSRVTRFLLKDADTVSLSITTNPDAEGPLSDTVEGVLIPKKSKARSARSGNSPLVSPYVGASYSGRASIAFIGSDPAGEGTFNGTLSGGELSNYSYIGATCIDPGKANPGVAEPTSQVGNYYATVTAIDPASSTASVQVTIVPDSIGSNYQRIAFYDSSVPAIFGGQFRLRKFSAQPDITNGNKCYNFTGAKYGVFRDQACRSRVDTLTVQNNDGYTNFSQRLSAGTYYVKEEKGTAIGYAVNPHVMACTVENGVYDKTVNLNTRDMLEPILDDPISILVEKSFSDWDK